MLHNNVVSHYTIEALQYQFRVNLGAFSCEFAQFATIALSKSWIFMQRDLPGKAKDYQCLLMSTLHNHECAISVNIAHVPYFREY